MLGRTPVDQSHHRMSSHPLSPWLWDVSTINQLHQMECNVFSEGSSGNENVALMSCHQLQKEPTLWMMLGIFDGAHICHVHQYSFDYLCDCINDGNFIFMLQCFIFTHILLFSPHPDAPHSTSIGLFPVGEVTEGGSVTLTCTSDAAPPVESFAWFKGTGQQCGHT